jgi:hypothetical protein
MVINEPGERSKSFERFPVFKRCLGRIKNNHVACSHFFKWSFFAVPGLHENTFFADYDMVT